MRALIEPWSLAVTTTATNVRRVAVTTAALLTVVLVTSGCSHGAFGMGDHHDQMHGGGGGAPQTPVVSDSSRVSVDIANFDFSPRELTVAAGAEVTWTNFDSAPHDATDEDGAWGTGLLRQDEAATITFEAAGEYEYLCTIHPNMKGTLTVEEGP
ncbi:MAG TPA: cupredoxin family copper-binding protein [Dehalococcoidia bacterium]